MTQIILPKEKSVFQKAADWILSRKTPEWLARLCETTESILKEIGKILSEECVNFLKEEVFRQSKLDISDNDKLENVIRSFRERFVTVEIGDHLLSIAIKLIWSEVKKMIGKI